MSGQITQVGGQHTLNKLCGLDVPIVGGTEAAACAAWVPGKYWVDTSSGTVVKGSSTGVLGSWNPVTGNRYLTLLTASPSAAVNVSDLVEVSTTGYARAPVTFSPQLPAAYPYTVFNSALVTWGPFSADMLPPAAQWVALVSSASGTTGSFLYWWALPEPVLAPASQPIQIPTGGLVPGSGLYLDQA